MRDAVETLKRHDLAVTAQRLAVMRAVANRPHATAEEVLTDVRQAIGAVSKQAIYNVLSMLSDKGLLRRIEPAGSAARYEDRTGDNHHHVVCRRCGKTEDVDCAVGHAPCLHAIDDRGYRIDEAEVVYWGICPDCRNLPPKA